MCTIKVKFKWQYRGLQASWKTWEFRNVVFCAGKNMKMPICPVNKQISDTFFKIASIDHDGQTIGFRKTM